MARVLVVDDNPWTQRMVSSVLRHAGHTVDIAADGWEGLVAAGHLLPDLVVVKGRLPTADGWKVVETLRGRPEANALPAMFLVGFAEQERRGPDFRADRDDVLVTPFRLEDLLARVTGLLERAAARGPQLRLPLDLPFDDGNPHRMATPAGESAVTIETPVVEVTVPEPQEADDDEKTDLEPVEAALGLSGGASGRSALAGALDQFGAASLLMLLELERRSGVLILSAETARARIFVRSGRVLRAAIEGQPHPRGAVVVYTLLTWNQGRFEFHAGDVDGEDEVGSSTSYLLMEGARLQDEGAPWGDDN